MRLRIVKGESGNQHVENECRDAADQNRHDCRGDVQQVASVSPTRKPAPASIPGTGRAASALMTLSTRKIGKKMDIELTKGIDGLGFSVTTRDNPAGGQCPIYIKNILPRGDSRFLPFIFSVVLFVLFAFLCYLL